MHNLFRQGAFQGQTPRDAYFVKCDKETTTQNDINLGIVNIVVGFAPLKPAEFVVIKLQQMAGQIAGLGRSNHGAVHRQRAAFRPLQELQVPREVGRALRRRRQQGQRAQAHHRGGQAPRGRRPEQQPQVAGPHRVRGDHARARRHPRHGIRAAGRTRSGTSAPGWAPRSRSKDFRKDIIIEVYNEAGQLAIAYKVYRCWVSEFQALPDLDANANAVAIQHLKLENEGWERDYRRAGAPGGEPRSRTVMTMSLSEREVLGVWDRAATGAPVHWSLALLRACWPEARGTDVAALTAAERDQQLLVLRGQLFGDAIDCCSDCPACAEQVEFSMSASGLLDVLPETEQPLDPVRVGDLEIRCRRPTCGDLAQCIGRPVAHRKRSLVEACIGEWSATARSPRRVLPRGPAVR